MIQDVTSHGLMGNQSIQDPKPSSDDLQSSSLSKKQKNLFTISPINERFSNYTYTGENSLASLKIVRYAIKNCAMPASSDNQFTQGELIHIEKEIFRTAIALLGKSKSAEDAIKSRTDPSSQPFPNNVVLVDIFATVKEKNSNKLRIKEDEGKKQFAETHTICLWKKTETQLMVIDPSSSQLSERLESSVQSILREDPEKTGVKCNIVEHPEAKFYTLPVKPNFVEKSNSPDKLRDCIDMALKVGIVLNEGTKFYTTTYEVQNSINLLSNQSAVNPILGNTNDCTSIKHLQSTRMERRSVAINAFSFIPVVFKQFFNHSAWLKFTSLDNEKQAAILKALTVFNKEIGNANNFFDKKVDIELHFTRLEKLSIFCDRITSLKRDLQDDGEITFKLRATSFNTKKI